MDKKVGLLEIVCDAPPYAIVQACARIGIDRPEDCRWERVGPHTIPCSKCGYFKLEEYDFTYTTGGVGRYKVRQCKHCRRVYWQESKQ